MSALPGVVVVTYQSGRWITACLDGLERSLPSGTCVVLVDNASTDGTRRLVDSWIAARRAAEGGGRLAVQVVACARNLGFGAANNLGVRRLEAEWAPSQLPDPDRWIVLVNPDVVVDDFDLDALAQAASDPRVGALALSQRDAPCTEATPRLRPFPSTLEVVMEFSWALLIPAVLHRERRFWLGAGSSRSRECWPSGGFLAVRRGAWMDVGGFDERYFLFWEDVDLGRRLLAAGWSCAPSRAATGLHGAPEGAPGHRGADRWKLSWALAGWLTYRRIWNGRRSARSAALLTLTAQAAALTGLVPFCFLPGGGVPFRRKSKELGALVRLLVQGLRPGVEAGAGVGAEKHSEPEPGTAIRKALM
jgi:N-acetylglucosaminyl-diphospho-decaprenol L-rhamnosyltransferase